MSENGVFDKDIKFNIGNEKGNILSHNILSSWKNIDNKLVYTDAKFSVEKYIEDIEKYKKSGKNLTKEQEVTYNKAIKIKENLSKYRKAVNVNNDVTEERNDKRKRFFKEKETKTLPEAKEE